MTGPQATNEGDFSQDGGTGEVAARFVNSAIRDMATQEGWRELISDIAEVGGDATAVQFGFVTGGDSFVVDVRRA